MSIHDSARAPRSADSGDLKGAAGAGRLEIVSGASGSGKTTWCRALVERAVASGEPVDGIVCPAVFADGAKIAIDVITIGDSVRRRLAWRRSAGDCAPGELAWRFDDAVLRDVDAYIARLAETRFVVIDEIGPLELLGGGGWQSALKLIEARSCERVIVTIRPSLLETALQRWPWATILAEDLAAVVEQ
jgi:nucleoside-triphosphatase THEP1